MNRSFHKSQTLRFYDCSAVEVKSKVRWGPAVCAHHPPAPRMNGHPEGDWAAREGPAPATTSERGASVRCAGVPQSFPPLRAHKARQPGKVRLEPRRSEGRAAAGPFARVALLFHKPAAIRRTARWRGDVSGATRGLNGFRALEGPWGPGPGEGPGCAASYAAEEPRNRRGGDRQRVLDPRTGPPVPSTALRTSPLSLPTRPGPDSPGAPDRRPLPLPAPRPKRAQTCGWLCAFG